MKCLTERYRMVADSNDEQAIKTSASISHSWYTKASYQNPQIGHLYYHLVTTSNLFSLKQLSDFSRSLTCIIPFEGTREYMMNLFNPTLPGEESITCHAARIIKAHVLQVCHQSMDEFRVVQKDLHGSLQDHVKKIWSDFKEQGVYLATARP